MDSQTKDYIDISIDKKLDSLQTNVREIRSMMDRYASGFPGNDPEGHRKYHESVIERNKAYADLGRKLLFELTKWGLIGFLGWLAISGWHEILGAIRSGK